MWRKTEFASLLLTLAGSAGALLSVPGTVAADTLLIEGVEQAAASQSQRPARGETKARVEERFGQPTRMVGAVGDPPISRWEYPGFTVFFEYERVIHAVPRRQS